MYFKKIKQNIISWLVRNIYYLVHFLNSSPLACVVEELILDPSWDNNETMCRGALELGFSFLSLQLDIFYSGTMVSFWQIFMEKDAQMSSKCRGEMHPLSSEHYCSSQQHTSRQLSHESYLYLSVHTNMFTNKQGAKADSMCTPAMWW